MNYEQSSNPMMDLYKMHKEYKRRVELVPTLRARVINGVLEASSSLLMNRNGSYSADYFDRNHAKKVNSGITGPIIKRMYRHTAEQAYLEPTHLKPGSQILDIGCGVGILVQQFRQLGYNATGVDVNEEAISHSIEPENCNLVKSTARLPYHDNSFDLITSREVLEHIPQNQIDDCIDEWDRVSKGLMIHIIAVTERGKSATSDPMHVNVQTEDWWAEKFAEHGYATLKNPNPQLLSFFGSKGYMLFVK